MKFNPAWAAAGKWFTYQYWPEVEPDIVCVAKALSGGFVPVGAIITRPKIMDSVFNSHGALRRSLQHLRPKRSRDGRGPGEPCT